LGIAVQLTAQGDEVGGDGYGFVDEGHGGSWNRNAKETFSRLITFAGVCTHSFTFCRSRVILPGMKSASRRSAIDDLDRKILAALQLDPRASWSKIGDLVGTSET